jgi:uncharacterized protein with HEPN domain
MRKSDRVRLQHMLDAAREALEFASSSCREELERDRKLVLALVKDIEIVGEAAYQVSEETRELLPDLPWEDMIAMRHRLVHGYFDIDLDVLWQTVQQDLPLLVEKLKAALRAGE